MIKLLGNVLVLAFLYSLLVLDPHTADAARSAENHRNLAERIGLYGILGLAAGLLIITGGIDLSIGSTVAVCGVALSILLMHWQLHPAAAIALVLILGACIGLVNGILVGLINVQPFVVTLCFLFIYRSAARELAGDQTIGLSNQFEELKDIFNDQWLGIPVHFLVFVALLAVIGVFLHASVYGRYFFAIGSNEKAARYCGINTTLYKILAYVMCSTLTALFAVLYLFKFNSIQPSSTGESLELYGIAAAVMGGCSLRGGEGTVPGIFLGTCIIYLLPNYAVLRGFRSSLEPALFGTVLLLAAVADEMLQRYRRQRRA